MLNFEVRWRLNNLMGMPADWTELPFLETIHVRKSPAGGAPDNEVHIKEVMRVILINIYRLIVKLSGLCFRYTATVLNKNTQGYVFPEGRKKRNPFNIGSSHTDVTMEQIEVMGVSGLPLIQRGDNISEMICNKVVIQEGDILCIASTIYSKAKGYTQHLTSIVPSEKARRLATLNGEDPGSFRPSWMHPQT